MAWRTGTKVPINVYDGDRPVCQCQTALDAKHIVEAVNYYLRRFRSLDDAPVQPEPAAPYLQITVASDGSTVKILHGSWSDLYRKVEG